MFYFMQLINRAHHVHLHHHGPTGSERHARA